MSLAAPAIKDAPPSRYERRVKQALWVCAVAFVIHLLPLFWLHETPESRLVRARETGDIVRRAEILRPLEKDTRATAAELRDGAGLLLSLGASGDARFLAEEAMRREPRSFDTQLLLVRIFALERMPLALETAVTRAESLLADDVRPRLVLARYFEKEGDLARARAALETLHARHPDVAEVTTSLARLSIETGALARAEALLADAATPRAAPEQLVALALLRLRQDRLAEARLTLERAVVAAPALGEAHYLLGSVRYREGNPLGAESALRTADRLAPDDPRALAALCALQAETGRVDAARATGTEFRRRFPRHADTLTGPCRAG